jgi:hypothetical protein
MDMAAYRMERVMSRAGKAVKAWVSAEVQDGLPRIWIHGVDYGAREDKQPRRHVRGWLSFPVPRNPICARWGHRIVEVNAYTLPPALFGWDPWRTARADYERRGEAGKRGWEQCARCHRRVGSSHRRIELFAELAIRFRADVGFTVKAEHCGEPDWAVHLHSPFGSLFLGANNVAPRVLWWLTPRLGEQRELSARLHRFDETTVLSWDLWTAEILGSQDWTWRYRHIPVGDMIRGQLLTAGEDVEVDQVAIPLPEGSRPATVTLRRCTSRRARWPHGVKIRWAADVDPETPTPVPGNPDSDFCDDHNAIHSAHFPVAGRANWQAEAVGAYVTTVLRDRQRYGRTIAWQPKQEAE